MPRPKLKKVKFTVRFSERLHGQLKRLAKLNEESLQRLAVRALKKEVQES